MRHEPFPTRMLIATAAFAAIVVASGPVPAIAAEDAVAKGTKIAREADRRDQGFRDSRTTLTMILEDQKGRTRERRLNIFTFESRDPGLGDKSLIVFESPNDMKGTAFLTHARILEDDDQWIYLPALKRVKRISSSNKTSSFFGSEFSYEDIAAQEFGKFDHRWLRDAPCGDTSCFVVERRPKYPNSGYERLETWFDADEYRIRRIDYFDHRGALLKTLTLGDYRQYLGNFWRAHEFIMNNRQTGKRTTLRYDTYVFRTGVSEDVFNKGRLERVR